MRDAHHPKARNFRKLFWQLVLSERSVALIPLLLWTWRTAERNCPSSPNKKITNLNLSKELPTPSIQKIPTTEHNPPVHHLRKWIQLTKTGRALALKTWESYRFQRLDLVGGTRAWSASGWKEAGVQHSASPGKQRGIERYQNIPQVRREAFQPTTGRLVLVNTECVNKKVSRGYNHALRTLPQKSFSLQTKWWVWRNPSLLTSFYMLAPQQRTHKQCEILLGDMLSLQNTVMGVTSS